MFCVFCVGSSDLVSGPLPILGGTLTQSGRGVPVEEADEEAMLITWPGLSTMI